MAGTAALCVLVVLVCRFVFRLGNRARSRLESKRGQLLHALCWSLNLGLYAAASWTAVAYGRCYTPDDTNEMISSWFVSLAITWLVTEPIVIILLVVLPLLGGTKSAGYFNRLLESMQKVGIDPTLFF